jgi:hypothetical protein
MIQYVVLVRRLRPTGLVMGLPAHFMYVINFSRRRQNDGIDDSDMTYGDLVTRKCSTTHHLIGLFHSEKIISSRVGSLIGVIF